MRTSLGTWVAAVVVAAFATGLAACGDDDTGTGGAPDASIVVTTNILGDIVGEIVGDDAAVEVVMPPNASPHDFAASARQVAAMREADVLVVNGLGFEEGLEDTIDAAEDDGATVLALTDHVPDHLGADDAHEDEASHAAEGGGEHDGEDEHEDEHEHEGEDPHVFTDPARMAVAVAGLAEELAVHVDGLDTAAFRERAAAYVGELEALDAEVEQLVATVPAERRILVTNHEVFGYFADRYGFEVLGTVIPSLSTLAEPSAADLADLADAIAAAGVPVVFAETSSPTRLADALAAEGTDVEVVELFGESLGAAGSGGETYLDMVRTNAERITAALTR